MNRSHKMSMAAIAGLMVVALMPSAAWAPKVFRRQVITGASCTVDAVPGTFAGHIEVTHLTSAGDVVSIAGVLDGNCTIGETWAPVPLGTSVSLPATVPVHSCQQGFRFDHAGTTTLPNMTVTMAIDVPIELSDSNAKRLCAASNRFDAGRTEAVVRILNTLISASAREDGRQLQPR